MQTNHKNGNRKSGDARHHKNPSMNASAFIRRIAALALLIGFNAWGQSLDAPFTRVTTGPWTESAQSVSVAACDYNNDGWPDLFVGHHGTASALYRNDHGTNFIKVTSGPIATTLIGSAHAAAWADYDNDGWPDLVVANLKDPPNPSTYLFHGLGDGSFERVLSGPVATNTGRAVAVSWADYTGDGLLDLFVGRGAVVLDVPDTLYATTARPVFQWTLTSPSPRFAPIRVSGPISMGMVTSTCWWFMPGWKGTRFIATMDKDS